MLRALNVKQKVLWLVTINNGQYMKCVMNHWAIFCESLGKVPNIMENLGASISTFVFIHFYRLAKMAMMPKRIKKDDTKYEP